MGSRKILSSPIQPAMTQALYKRLACARNGRQPRNVLMTAGCPRASVSKSSQAWSLRLRWLQSMKGASKIPLVSMAVLSPRASSSSHTSARPHTAAMNIGGLKKADRRVRALAQLRSKSNPRFCQVSKMSRMTRMGAPFLMARCSSGSLGSSIVLGGLLLLRRIGDGLVAESSEMRREMGRGDIIVGVKSKLTKDSGEVVGAGVGRAGMGRGARVAVVARHCGQGC
ncbi:hypothetical protein PG984_015036 [Apiospora sp. TS-2023a]